ncbi:MAG: carbon-nitrogen hydrolase [Planctomycetota bacterium]
MTAQVQLAMIQMRGAATPAMCVDRAIDQIRLALGKGSQIICLQELFTGPYPCQTEDHCRFDDAEPIPGPSTLRLADFARQHEIVIVAPLFERRAPGLYHNSAAVIDADGKIVDVYRKMHIPDDPLFYEKFYFTPGDRGFRVVQTRYAKLGVGICWDQWFPEAARLFALAGAEILLYPTAIGWIDDEKDEFGAAQRDAWQTSMRAHAIANGLFVGAANRVGIEGRLEFWGSSFIADPNGVLLAEGSIDQEQIVSAEIQLSKIDLVRTHWPFLRDRRIDAYDGLLKRYLD